MCRPQQHPARCVQDQGHGGSRAPPPLLVCETQVFCFLCTCSSSPLRMLFSFSANAILLSDLRVLPKNPNKVNPPAQTTVISRCVCVCVSPYTLSPLAPSLRHLPYFTHTPLYQAVLRASVLFISLQGLTISKPIRLDGNSRLFFCLV